MFDVCVKLCDISIIYKCRSFEERNDNAVQLR